MMIIHRCVRCGHIDLWWRNERGRCNSDCQCTKKRQPCEPGEPETIPTFSSRPGTVACQPESKIWPPGSVAIPFPIPRVLTCDCESCGALYAAMTA
jgi:hypothetical protein